MTKEYELKVSDIDPSFTVTACFNGYMVEMSGKDSNDDWRSVKYLTYSIDEMFDVIRSMNDKFDLTRQ